MPGLYLHHSQNILKGLLDDFNTCLQLSIALMVVWSWYCLLYVQVSAKCFVFLWNKFTTCDWHYFLEISIFYKQKKQVYMPKLSYLLIIHPSSWWLDIYYNNFQCIGSSYYTDRKYLHNGFPWFVGYLWWIILSLDYIYWISSHVKQFFQFMLLH